MVDIPGSHDTVYRWGNRPKTYVEYKCTLWRPDFWRVASCYALGADARRAGAIGVLQFLYLAVGGRSLRSDSGKLHVYDRGSFNPRGRVPSGGIIAIRREYVARK